MDLWKAACSLHHSGELALSVFLLEYKEIESIGENKSKNGLYPVTCCKVELYCRIVPFLKFF
jgi:hypothetical protein